MVGWYALACELAVEGVGHDETDHDKDIAEQHDLGMLNPVPRATTDEIVAPLVYQPVQDAEAEEDCKAQHFVNVERIPKDDRQQEKLQDLLLALLKDVLLLDDANVAEEYPNQQIGELNKDDNNGIKEDQQIQFLWCQIDKRAEDRAILVQGSVYDVDGDHHARDRVNLE